VYLNGLLGELRKATCENVQEKIKDANHLQKFYSIISELEIAKFLIYQGKHVTLLTDDYMKNSPPDMLVTCNGQEAYVEVKRITHDESINLIEELLTKFLQKYGYCFRVDLTLSHDLSIPVTKCEERKFKENLTRKTVEEFKEKFSYCDLSRLPLEINVLGTRFEIRKSEFSKGYIGFIHTACITVPREKLIKKIKRDVCEKAFKRINWSAEHRKKIYIVAIDCEQYWVSEDDVNEALIGRGCYFHSTLPMPPWAPPREVKEKIETAKQKGWKEFLIAKHIIPYDRTRLEYDGIYFTRSETGNISAVLVRKGNKYYFVPNPFAFDEINDPNLTKYLTLLNS